MEDADVGEGGDGILEAAPPALWHPVSRWSADGLVDWWSGGLGSGVG